MTTTATIPLLTSAPPAGASTTTVTVGQSSIGPSGRWGSPAGADTGSAGFRTGPGTPPAGAGSLAMKVPAGQHRSFYDYQFGVCANWPAGFPNCTTPSSGWLKLSDITALGYSTYRISGADTAANAAPSLNIEVDPTGTGAGYTTLVWEPAYNGGTLTDDAWQTWDAFNGGNGNWWSTATIPGAPALLPVPWSTILSNNANAKVRYGLGPNVGNGPKFSGAVDAVTVGVSGNDTVFDFEATSTSTVIGSGDTSLFPTPATEWVSHDDGNAAAPGDITYVTGPATPPSGTGSVRLTTATGTGASALVYLDPSNAATRFDQLANVSYSTYRSSVDSGDNLAVALQLNADYDKTDTTTTWQGRLVFEPYQGVNGNVPQNTWQTWTPLTSGVWWMSASNTFPPKVGNATVPKACPQSSPCTWAQVLNAYPNAGFNSTQPFVVFKAGSGGSWPGFVGNVDDFHMSVNDASAAFDFEPDCTTDCYVATTGSDSNTGSATDPFLTVQKAVNTVSVGGTVHIANGTYNAGAVVNKNITIDGQSRSGTVINGPGAGSGPGLDVGPTSGVTISHLTVKNFDYGVRTLTGPISNFTVTHADIVDNVVHGIWSQASGVTNYTLDDVNASRNNQAGGLAGRGFWMINGVKSGVTVTNSTFDKNGLVGIDLSDGTVTGATITNNVVTNNGDSGIGVLGAIGGSATLVANNTVTDNGRYGVEIKQSTGDGTDTGPNSVTVRDNTISRTVAATDARDYAGIALIRRFPASPSPTDVSGIVVENNSVSGFHRKPSGSTGDGFGIAAGGTGHVITENTVTNNDVGVQLQAGNSINTQSTPYFDRDDSANGGASIVRNAITGNGLGLRTVGSVTGSATCNWYGAASGPGAPGGAGAGDGISSTLGFSPWLLTSNLNGTCPGSAPTISIGSVSNPEGSGTDPVVNVPVTLSNPYGATVTVNYTTVDGSGAAGAVAPNDYTATSGTVTFLGGETSKTIPVTIRGNAGPVQFDEKDETFTVVLSAPTNATIASGTGTVTILNDDTPTVSIPSTPVSVVEGNSGTQTVTVPVTLTNPSAFPITVNYTTTNGSAAAPSDYVSTSGTVTIPAGQLTATFPVSVKGDTTDETNESFSVSISSPAGGGSVPPILGNSSESIQINNDDTPTVSVGTSTIDTVEGNSGTHTVPVTISLNNPSVVAISVNYATSNGSAVTTGDYLGTSGTVTFNPGDTTKTVNVTVKGDTALEDYEYFNFTISGPTAAATGPTLLGNATQKVQILNDEKPSLTGTAPSGKEGSKIVFGATLVQRYYQSITVNYFTSDGTATAPGDYTGVSGNIVFPAGTNGTQTVGVQTNFDFTTEVAETFNMNWLSSSVKVSPLVKKGTIKSNIS